MFSPLEIGGMLMSRSTVAEGIKIALRTQSELLGRKLRPDEANGVIARSTLHGELGYLDDGNPTGYDLDDETRDRLIAHGRQDSAHALLNTISTSQKVEKLSRRVNFLFLVVIALLVYIAYGIAR
jgi:hypothetical protein